MPATRAPEKLPPALSDRVGFLLAKNSHAVRALAEETLRPLGLDPENAECNPSHVGCLAVIASEGPLSQQQLGERVRIDRTSVVAIVDYLEGQGFVARHRNPEDRRAYALEATQNGREWLKQALAALVAVEERYLEPLSSRERDQLNGLLQRLLLAS